MLLRQRHSFKNPNRVRTILVLILFAVMEASCKPRAERAKDAAVDPLAQARYADAEDLGEPILSTKTIHCVVTQEEGRPVLCTTVSGSPAKFNVFDLESNSVLHSFDVPKGGTFWVHGVDSHGDVYFAGYVRTTLYRYSVQNKTVTEIGPLFGEQGATALTFDDEDNVYIGTFPGAKLIKYDRASGQLVDLGNVLPGEQYLKSLAFHNGFLYGGGLKQGTAFVRIHPVTMERKVLPAPKSSSPITAYCYAIKAGGKMFFNCSLTDHTASLFIFDPEREQWLDFEAKNFQGLVTSPEIDGVVYYPADKKIWAYRLATGEVTDMGMAYTTAFRGGGVASLKSDARFARPSFVNIFYSGNPAIYDFPTKTARMFSQQVTPTGGVIVRIAMFGGEVMVGNMMGTEVLFFDPNKREVTRRIPMGQPESIVEYGGKAYFGVYPSASVEKYDPALPVEKGVNPAKLFDVKSEGQSRPFGLAFSGTKLIAGTIADYGMLEGALSVFELESKKMRVYKNLIPQQSIGGLVARDGFVYAGTTVWGGLGIDPSASAAVVFKFDLAKESVVLQATPKFPGVGTPPKAVGGFAFGPDGLLWGVAYGTVFAMDPETLEVKKSVAVVPTNWNSPGRQWGGRSIAFDSHGLIVAAPFNTLVAVDPETLRWKKLLPAKFDRMVHESILSNQDEVYFSSGSHLMRIRSERP